MEKKYVLKSKQAIESLAFPGFVSRMIEKSEVWASGAFLVWASLQVELFCCFVLIRVSQLNASWVYYPISQWNPTHLSLNLPAAKDLAATIDNGLVGRTMKLPAFYECTGDWLSCTPRQTCSRRNSYKQDIIFRCSCALPSKPSHSDANPPPAGGPKADQGFPGEKS